MGTWRHRIANIFRLLGIAGAIIITGLGIYLPYEGLMDWALLPFLMAFLPPMLGDMLAVLIDSRHLLKNTATVPYCQPHARQLYE